MRAAWSGSTLEEERDQPRRSWWPLVAVCVAANVAEAAVVAGFGVTGGPQLAPQAAAPPPLGLFSDLRWLLVYERSWWTFALGVVALLVARTLLTAWQTRLAWPLEAAPPPAFGRLAARAAVFNVVVGLLLAPFALILFGFAAFPISWLYFAAVPTVVIFAVLLHEGGVSPRWWRQPPGLRPVGWMLATVAVLTVAGGVISAAPRVLAVPVAAVAGVFEAAAWAQIVGGALCRPKRRFAPVVPAVIVLFVVGAVVGAATGFANGRVPTVRSGAPATADLGGRTPVLVVEGFSSHWSGGPVPLLDVPAGTVPVEFSYRGSTSTGAPLAYPASATHASLAHLAALMARQVDALARTAGRPVDIVAVSEGSAVAQSYLSSACQAPVRGVVLVSPLLHPGTVFFPPAGKEGWGMAAGRGLSLLGSWLGPISTVDLSPDQPFLRSLVDADGSLDHRGACGDAATAVRVVQVVPLADSVAGAPSAEPGVQTVVTAAFHGADSTDPAVRSVITEVLTGRPVPGDGLNGDLAHLIGALASTWRVPALLPFPGS